MSDELNLSLPERAGQQSNREQQLQRQYRTQRVLTALVLAAVIANIIIVLAQARRPGRWEDEKPGMLSPDAQKALAMKLEKQGMGLRAAEAWKDYLAVRKPDTEESAKIWYRIGTLYQDAGQPAEALENYYRSESLAALDDLSSEINRRTQACLEAMGKFAALRYELTERVGMNTNSETAGDEVVAEIGPQKITRAELDRKIEAGIERQLSQFASYLPDEERKKQKESMLKQFSSSSQRQRFLTQFILEDILCRKARESGLRDDPEVRALIEDQERSILARKVIDKELAEQIKITPGDLTTYYEANKKDYVSPETARISHILVADEETATNALERLKSGEDFDKLAGELSIDEATREKGGRIEGSIEKGGNIPGIGYSDRANELIFATEPGQTAREYVKSEKGFHVIKVLEREPGQQKPFDEVRTEVFQALRSQKEREVQEKLFSELKDRYNVVIHHAAFPPEAGDEKQE